MAKKKKSSKRRSFDRRISSGKRHCQETFHSYDTWKSDRPCWLKEIRTLIDQGDIVQARTLLAEEKIQAKLAAIDPSDTANKFFVRCEAAMLLDETDQAERALQYYSDTLKIVNCAGVYNKIGMLYAALGHSTEALVHFKKAEQLEPDGAYIWTNLAKCLMGTGRQQEAVSLLRKAIAANPRSREAYPNLLYGLNFLPETGASEIFEESRKWAHVQAPTTWAYLHHNNPPEPDKKVRIGYLSPDFKKHSVTYFFEPLLNGHDRNKFEIYGYGDVRKPDIVTEKLIGKFDCYRNIMGIGDKEAAELIRSDSIDILVDLAGHTGRNRLGVLAYKPAPIQVTYLGYPNTTGMTQVDYRFTDAIADPADQQRYYTEKLTFLPNGFLCYDPSEALLLPLSPLPMTSAKYVTFGCFNNINKLNPMIIKLWVDILKTVPDSKLILKFKEGRDEQVRAYYHDLFKEQGLEDARNRVTIFGWVTNAQHLELYSKVDIALDTYPYNGTTTTCEAFAMGVPVITLAGQHHASRIGLDLLTRLGIPSFAAATPAEYVTKATALAAEPESLAQLRATMRQRLAASPLCNHQQICADIENAYLRMWQDYCGSKGIETTHLTVQENMTDTPPRYPKIAATVLVAGDKDSRPALSSTKHAAPSLGKSAVRKSKQIRCLSDWIWPDWLKEASSWVRQGEPEKAAHILTEESLTNYIAAAQPPENEFIRYVAAGLLHQCGQQKRAEGLYKEALKFMPKNLALYNELAFICRDQGRISEAVDYLTMANKIDPDQPLIWCNLGANLMRLGQTDKALSLLRKTVQKLPDNNAAHSNLLLSLHHVQDADRKEIFEESKRWAKRNFPVQSAKTEHSNTPDPHRRLRIGYISPDFREHSVTFFFEPLLDGHHRQAVEVYGYGSIAVPDETTKRLMKKFDVYRSIQTLNDSQATDLIAKDEIDILVDLAGHTGNTRVYVLGYKPAPVQVTWLGYPDTTGMSQVDYRLTDAIADPNGAEKFHAEKLFYLPDGFLCYGPGETMPNMAPLPALEKGHITFGAFNGSEKINPAMIRTWSKILMATRNSKLFLKLIVGRDDTVRKNFLQQFEVSGISPERIVIGGWLSRQEHLKLYNQVDISLDTFPYNGTTTTCQSLLMGVPVITLVGDCHMSRVGLDILSRLDMQFFAAATPEDYVAKAVALASRPEALAKIRASMRARMAASPLCNRELFACHIEQAYRTMWHRWCQTKGIDVSVAATPGGTDAAACCTQSTPNVTF